MERSKPISTLRTLALAGVLTATGLTLAGCDQPKPKKTATPASPAAVCEQEIIPQPSSIDGPVFGSSVDILPSESVEDVILKQAKKEVSVLDPKEKNLWSDNPYPTSSGQKDNGSLTLFRVFGTLNLMSQSKNKYFQDAQNFFLTLFQATCLDIEPTQSNGDFGVGSNFDATTGNFFIGLEVSEDFTLNRSTSLIMASSLTHAAKSAQRLLEYTESLPSGLSIPEKQQKTNAFIQKELTVDPQGYAAESASYITEIGLLDEFYTVPTSGIDARALNFIADGMDANNENWKSYLNTINQNSTQQPSSLLVEFPKI